ncbi:MAG: hypothetical protein FWH35_06120 [Treponema sp.]|nr:hypothetical protein [Treponema sp.]
MSRVNITLSNVKNYFYLELLSVNSKVDAFKCSIVEYNDYLINDAHRSMSDYIALTWLLTERKTDKIAAYMSLIMDAIKFLIMQFRILRLPLPYR